MAITDTSALAQNLTAAGNQREITAAQADITVDFHVLDFETTENLEPLEQIIGQDRAIESFEVGLGIKQDGYNIIVTGLTGSGKMATITRSVEDKLKNTPVPSDWVYVNNFQKPDEPIAIPLEPGKARQFKKDMKNLLDRLLENLAKAFRQEEFSSEKQRLGEKYNKLFGQQVDGLAAEAKQKGFEMTSGPQGNIFFIPLIDGKVPESPEQLKDLPSDEKDRIQQNQDQLSQKAAKIMQNQHDMLHSLSEEVRNVEKQFGQAIVAPIVQNVKDSYSDNPKVLNYLYSVAANVLENLADFRDGGGKKQMPMGPFGMVQDVTPSFTEYQVNIVVDNFGLTKAPLITEASPTYRNLFGTIERMVDGTGRFVTNFTQIKAGSMLSSNGGFLVFNLTDALTEPFVYRTLKRTLKSGVFEFEAFDAFMPFSVTGLRPEPIPIRTKVIVIASTYLYYALRFYDEDFASVFKVRADFGFQMPRTISGQENYARFVAKKARDEKMLPFMRDAVTELIRFGARRSGEKDKLVTQFTEIADLMREANYFALKENAALVSLTHVKSALNSRIYRADRIADKIRELIARGTIIISTDTMAKGQINGIAILDFGDYMFGRPSRLTVSLGLGAEGVINIEREARLSGSTHDKGVLILAGYIRNLYGKDKPLALSASLCFEQSYGGIDGDSASSAELFVLLATLADVPIRQDIAVTGSVNQWGQIQAIGAVNEKIEGFYDVCRNTHFTGRQGVAIPASNIENLILREDVRQAIADGSFHVYPIETVDHGLELLTGLKAGSIDEENTLHWLINNRLRELARQLRDFGKGAEGARVTSSQQQAPPNVPPRMPDEQP